METAADSDDGSAPGPVVLPYVPHEVLMSKRLLVLVAAGASALGLGVPALAQNVMGPHGAAASPAEVQQQMERQRHELDALNRPASDCDPAKGASVGRLSVGERGDPNSAATGGRKSDAAPHC